MVLLASRRPVHRFSCNDLADVERPRVPNDNGSIATRGFAWEIGSNKAADYASEIATGVVSGTVVSKNGNASGSQDRREARVLVALSPTALSATSEGVLHEGQCDLRRWLCSRREKKKQVKNCGQPSPSINSTEVVDGSGSDGLRGEND